MTSTMTWRFIDCIIRCSDLEIFFKPLKSKCYTSIIKWESLQQLECFLNLNSDRTEDSKQLFEEDIPKKLPFSLLLLVVFSWFIKELKVYT